MCEEAKDEHGEVGGGQEGGVERRRGIRANTVTILLPSAPSPPPASARLSVNVRRQPCCSSSASSLARSAPRDESGRTDEPSAACKRDVGGGVSLCVCARTCVRASAFNNCEQFVSIAHSGFRQRAD